MSLFILRNKFSNSLQAKLMTTLLTIVIVTVISMGIISIYCMKENMEKEVYDKQRLLTESFQVEVMDYMTQHKNIIRLTAQLPVVQDMSAATAELMDVKYRGVADNQDVAKRALSKEMLKIYSSFAYFESFTPDKGISIMLEPYEVQLKIGPEAYKNGFSSRDWFKGAVTTQGAYLSEAYISASIGKQVVAISSTIKDQTGKISGIWIGVLPLDKLSDITKKLTFGKTGRAYLVDKNGVLIAHPDTAIFGEQKQLINIKDSPSVQMVLKKEKGNGIFYDPLSKTDVLAYYSPIPGTDWNIIVQQDVNEAFAAINQVKLIMFILGLTLLCIFSVVVYVVTKKITKPIISVTKAVKKAANGDLTAQTEVSSGDEIGQLATAANVMIANLRQLVTGVQFNAEQVAASSEELTASAYQAAEASNQVAGVVTEVATATEKQLKAVTGAFTVVEQMSKSLQQMTIDVSMLAEGAGKSAESAQTGVKSAQTAMKQMKKIEQTVNNSAQVVVKLGERSKEIGQIVDTISGIAGQTNLLALNAAIEAARAGEQGRGFAVVADEVRKLAEQSQEAAKQIAHVIGEIQGETDRAVVAMNEGTSEVKVGTAVVNEAGTAFQDIASMSEQAAAMMQGILAAVQQVASGSQQIVASMKEIDCLSKTTAGETETVAAATEEQSASMEEIATSSQGLAKMAQDLQEAASKFSI